MGCLALIEGHPQSAAPRPERRAAPLPSAFAEVDPTIGSSGGGNTFPGATLPFGMVQFSPDTSLDGWYRYDGKSVRGFSVTHLSGAGCPTFSDFPILPWLGEITKSPGLAAAGYALAFEHRDAQGRPLETAEPGYYSLTFPSGLRVELTATARTGIARIHFPAGQTRSLLFDGSANGTIDSPHQSSGTSQIAVPGRDEVTGSTSGGPFCEQSSNRYKIYFAARVDRLADSFGVWSDGRLATGESNAEAHRAGAYLTFAGNSADDLILKVGVSFVSVAGAEANLKAEQPGWDFEATRRSAREEWSRRLDKITVEGGTVEQRRIFYTGLYHMLIAPNIFNDVDGRYPGFDGQVHRLDGGSHYTNFSDWDTYRNVVQLQALLFPEETSQMMQSLVRDAEQAGSLPKWPVANDVSGVMGGDSPSILLASAYNFGATGFDAQAGLRYAVRAATVPGVPEQAATSTMPGVKVYQERAFLAEYLKLGYIPSELDQMSVSKSLEYANADFAISRLASSLGDRTTAHRFTAAAQRWRNVFDPSIGYMRPRLADGTFLPNFDLANTGPRQPQPWYKDAQLGFEEANTFQYSWMVPFNYAGLFDAMGGRERAGAKLDTFFTKYRGWANPYFNVENEPDFAAPYAYLFAAQPWKTQALVPKILAQTFSAAPDGIPGNDDLGATSGVYVWGALGLYPAIPGFGGLAIGSPMFPHATLALADGKVLAIDRVGEGPYVDSLTVNGARMQASWLDIDRLTPKGKNVSLQFRMAAQPNYDRGVHSGDLPPSFDGSKLKRNGSKPVHGNGRVP